MSIAIFEVFVGVILVCVGVYCIRLRKPLTEPAVRKILGSPRWVQYLFPFRFDRAHGTISAIQVLGALAILVGLMFLVSFIRTSLMTH